MQLSCFVLVADRVLFVLGKFGLRTLNGHWLPTTLPVFVSTSRSRSFEPCSTLNIPFTIKLWTLKTVFRHALYTVAFIDGNTIVFLSEPIDSRNDMQDSHPLLVLPRERASRHFSLPNSRPPHPLQIPHSCATHERHTHPSATLGPST